ncbi:MAG TPA: phosphatase PAP2 family protein [Planctomycetota bacterium]|nr:phosphatase PAP2 family protein [Planctomycetota bacterium]
MKKLFAFDWIVLGYLGTVSAIVVGARPEGAWIYLAYHALIAGLIALVVYAHDRFGGPFWTVPRYWYVVPVVLGAFRELHYLIPDVRPFNDWRFDRALEAIDRRWFGDINGFFLGAFPPAVMDLLHLCYWSYFFSMILVGAAIQRRGDYPKLREYATIVLTGLFLSYLGYFLVPAVGPHHFLHPRPAILDGWILGGRLHDAILRAEWEMPDAFPSGHALLSMIVLFLAWQYHRPIFRWIVLPATGCVLATVALRYHYLIDVVTSAAVCPIAVWAGRSFARWYERASGAPTGAGPSGA